MDKKDYNGRYENTEEHNHEIHKNNNHHNHHEMMIKDFKKRFFISVIVTVPILILSPMIQKWTNIVVTFTGSNYLLFALATFIYFYGGRPFLTGLKDELKEKTPGMMTLIAMAISVAYLYSTATVFGLEGNDFFWELATLIDIMLLGHWIEMKSVLSASDALNKLAALMPNTAHLFKDGDVVDVDISELRSEDRILIKPGEKVPADGIIAKGTSHIIVFDKTGTLTHGEFAVNFIEIFDDNYTQENVIEFAATLEINSEHPIATGIIKKQEDMGLSTLNMDNFKAIKGKGVEGTIDGKKIMVASPGYLREINIEVPKGLPEHGVSTDVFLIIDDKLVAAIGLSDRIREESYNAIKRLKEEGIKTWMLTGDNEKTAKYVSEELGLDGYFAEVLPEQKQEKVKELQSQGRFVAMTGDGVNDAPALAQANVGIAIGSGTDVAAETADIILVNSNPEDVVYLIDFGKATYKKMIQNLIWATGYNVVAIPLAAGVFSGIGIVISPAVGAVLMSFSTIIVAINAKLLKLER